MRIALTLFALLYSSFLISATQNKSVDPYNDMAHDIMGTLDNVVLEKNIDELENKLYELQLKYQKISSIMIFVKSGKYYEHYFSKRYDDKRFNYGKINFGGPYKVNIRYYESFILIDTPRNRKVNYAMTFSK